MWGRAWDFVAFFLQSVCEMRIWCCCACGNIHKQPYTCYFQLRLMVWTHTAGTSPPMSTFQTTTYRFYLLLYLFIYFLCVWPWTLKSGDWPQNISGSNQLNNHKEGMNLVNLLAPARWRILKTGKLAMTNLIDKKIPSGNHIWRGKNLPTHANHTPCA